MAWAKSGAWKSLSGIWAKGGAWLPISGTKYVSGATPTAWVKKGGVWKPFWGMGAGWVPRGELHIVIPNPDCNSADWYEPISWNISGEGSTWTDGGFINSHFTGTQTIIREIPSGESGTYTLAATFQVMYTGGFEEPYDPTHPCTPGSCSLIGGPGETLASVTYTSITGFEIDAEQTGVLVTASYTITCGYFN